MPRDVPIIGAKKNVEYPQVSVSSPGGGNYIVDITESAILSHRILLQEHVVGQIFIAFGSQCNEQLLKAMLQARAMNLGRIQVPNDVRPADERPVTSDSKQA